jgi:hypothetical protein
MSTFKFQGASGQSYIYMLTPSSELHRLPEQAGNYIFAVGNAADPVPIFAEEASRLRDSATSQWIKAQEEYGASLIYFRAAGEDQATRRAEKADLVKEYEPTMNFSTLGEE